MVVIIVEISNFWYLCILNFNKENTWVDKKVRRIKKTFNIHKKFPYVPDCSTRSGRIGSHFSRGMYFGFISPFFGSVKITVIPSFNFHTTSDTNVYFHLNVENVQRPKIPQE